MLKGLSKEYQHDGVRIRICDEDATFGKRCKPNEVLVVEDVDRHPGQGWGSVFVEGRGSDRTAHLLWLCDQGITWEAIKAEDK